jgi:uncharacterized membrane protein YfcA
MVPESLGLLDYTILAIVAFFFGWSKAGIKGLGIFLVTLMALSFGSKNSTGIVLPLLMVGDVFAIIYYRKYVLWKYILILLPSILVGILIGVWIGKELPESYFKRVMSVIIISSVAIMYYWEKRKSIHIPESKFFGIFMGFSAGFTTMIGNLAGAFSNIYFLIMRLPKNNFIGTAAYLYFIINLFKFPFHFFYWGTITSESLLLNLKVIPFQILGLISGVYIVGKINDQVFRKMILGLTAAGALFILFK